MPVTTKNLTDALAAMSPEDASVMRHRLGLDQGRPRTLAEVANHFGLDRDEVADIERRALAAARNGGGTYRPPHLRLLPGGTDR